MLLPRILFDDKHNKTITTEVTSGMDWVIRGEGIATIKKDGSCCAFIQGLLYKRYDAKRGKEPPKGAIPCSNSDPLTGHWPHWVKVDETNPVDKWFLEAMNNSDDRKDGTYEAIGLHFQGNPYNLEKTFFTVMVLKRYRLIEVLMISKNSYY